MDWTIKSCWCFILKCQSKFHQISSTSQIFRLLITWSSISRLADGSRCRADVPPVALSNLAASWWRKMEFLPLDPPCCLFRSKVKRKETAKFTFSHRNRSRSFVSVRHYQTEDYSSIYKWMEMTFLSDPWCKHISAQHIKFSNHRTQYNICSIIIYLKCQNKKNRFMSFSHFSVFFFLHF